MKRINMGFSGHTDAALLVLAQAIHTSLKDNTFFPTPTPTLAVLLTSIDDYTAALSAAQEGGKTNVATKNARKKDLIEVLIQLGNYVTLTANGNEVMLTSSGFPVGRERQPLPPLEKPEIISIESGMNSGELNVSIGAVKGARTYVYQYTLDPLTDNSNWISANSTLVKFEFTNLEPGKKYWCRAIAYGTSEQKVFSDPMLSRVVQ